MNICLYTGNVKKNTILIFKEAVYLDLLFSHAFSNFASYILKCLSLSEVLKIIFSLENNILWVCNNLS